MTPDENKTIVRRFVEEIFVNGRHETVDELLADDFVAHTWPSTTGDPKADLKSAIDRAAAGLSNPQFTVDDVIAEGDRVAVRLTTAATHSGPFLGMPASGKRYSIEEIHWFRLRDGKVVEHWHQFDQMGMMKQLGAMPGGSPGGGSPDGGSRDGGRPEGSPDGPPSEERETAAANR
jgi:steroid delta-isomerase-like uncharacterized protein